MGKRSTKPRGPDRRSLDKLEAAMILRGVVRLRLADGEVEVQPRTWYKEGGTHYLEAKRRDGGGRMRVPLDQIKGVSAF